MSKFYNFNWFLSNDSANTTATWTKKILNSFTINFDEIYQLVYDSNNRLKYHVFENVDVTTHAFNRFAKRYSKIVLFLINVLYFAKNAKKFVYVIHATKNFVNIMSNISHRRKNRFKVNLIFDRVTEINESFQIAQSMSKRIRYNFWRCFENEMIRFRNEISFNVFEYRYKQLEVIANFSQYRHIFRNFWLKNEVLYLFFHRASIKKWFEFNNERWFEYHFKHLLEKCDRNFKRHVKLNIEILMQISLRNYLSKIARFSNETWVIRNEIENEFWLFLNTSLSEFIDHRKYESSLKIEYFQDVEYSKNQSFFDDAKCNIVYENWFWNCEKYYFDDNDIEKVLLVRHRDLRFFVEIIRFWKLQFTIRTNDFDISAINATRKTRKFVIKRSTQKSHDSKIKAKNWVTKKSRWMSSKQTSSTSNDVNSNSNSSSKHFNFSVFDDDDYQLMLEKEYWKKQMNFVISNSIFNMKVLCVLNEKTMILNELRNKFN